MNKLNLKINKFIAFDGKNIIDLDRGVFNYSLNNFINKIRKIPADKLFGSSDIKLQYELKIAILKYLKIENNVGVDNISFGFGSYSILERIATKILDKGIMIGEWPQFRYFPMEYINAGGKYLKIPFKYGNFPKLELVKAIRNIGVKAVYINNPNNPTGQVWGKLEIMEIIKIAKQYRVLVIVDEVYGDLLSSNYSCADLVNTFDNLIVVRSFSKILGMQNLRLGYLIAGKKIVDQYSRNCNWNEITNLNAMLGIDVLQNKKYIMQLKFNNLIFKRKALALFKSFGFNILPTNSRVPIFVIQFDKKINLMEYFRRRNIKIEGGERYRVLDKLFPLNCARIRVPLTNKQLLLIKNRLCK